MDERRYYGFDALRGGMMILGIVVHACMFYLAAPVPGQHLFTDSTRSPVFDWLFLFIHNFRMPLFFLLSGFFTALLVEKRGLWGTYRNRAARVLAPLVVGSLTVVPLATLFLVSMMVNLRYGTHGLVPEWTQFMTLHDEAQALGFMPKDPAPAHLWFLYYLCLMYLLIPLCAWLARASVRAPAVRQLLASPAGLAVLGLWTTATLLPIQGGLLLPNSFTLSPNWSHVYYGSFFIIGYVLHANRDSLVVYPRLLRWTLPLAVVLFLLAEYLMRAALAAPGFPDAQLAAALANAFSTWAIIYVALGATLRYFDTASPWALYLSQSSYWVYLMHLPLVAIGGWALLGVAWPAEAKFLAIVAFTTVTCFASYHYAVQRTWVSVFLNGKRFDLDWPWRKPAGVPAPR